jgi:hypothetical protein
MEKEPADAHSQDKRVRNARFVKNYSIAGNASQAAVLGGVAPLRSKWITPGTSLQKLRIPEYPGTAGVAVTK